MYPEAKSVGAWMVGGWHVAVGYVLGFAILMVVHGWHPEPVRGKPGVAVSTDSTNSNIVNAIK
jgi:hypothetical protein